MNLQPDKKAGIELNLTPLIDVVFLLLIFFMVSTTFDKESRIRVNLPEATTKDEQQNERRVLDIIVDAKGHYYVDQEEVLNREPETLRRAIEKAAGERRDLPVIITADAQATHQAVMIVMDVASQLGLTQMTFAAKIPPEQN
ncbi:MAG: biopolymer transporter ExbD [Gammaproteobacteria bacterium]|nr:biopolymer transporter ExbD [Gammaproteobacteria bacterium]